MTGDYDTQYDIELEPPRIEVPLRIENFAMRSQGAVFQFLRGGRLKITKARFLMRLRAPPKNVRGERVGPGCPIYPLTSSKSEVGSGRVFFSPAAGDDFDL